MAAMEVSVESSVPADPVRRARLVRRGVMAVSVLGIAGMIAGSILDNNGIAITFGLVTAVAVGFLILLTAVIGRDAFRPSGLAADGPPSVDERVAASTLQAVTQAAALLAAAGAAVADEPADVDLARAMDLTVGYWERAARTGADAQAQLDGWDRYDRWVTRTLAGVDVVLMPVVADVAPPRRPLVGEDYAFTVPWSLTGWPAASVPMGHDPATGLPLAVQVVASRWHDHVVLAIAALLERAALAS